MALYYFDVLTFFPSHNFSVFIFNFLFFWLDPVEMAAPGMAKDDFKIELNNSLLSISSEKDYENETKEGKNVTRREFSYQYFSRSFTLPAIVETDRISAKYENGILQVKIPKKEEAKPKPLKQIKVS